MATRNMQLPCRISPEELKEIDDLNIKRNSTRDRWNKESRIDTIMAAIRFSMGDMTYITKEPEIKP